MKKLNNNNKNKFEKFKFKVPKYIERNKNNDMKVLTPDITSISTVTWVMTKKNILS